MTKNNEEKAKKITDRIFESGFNTNRTFYDMAKNAAMEMARWKDEQLEAEKQALIDKACEWLRNNSYMLDDWDEDKCWVTFEFTSKDEMIKEFHKTMKGGEE